MLVTWGILLSGLLWAVHGDNLTTTASPATSNGGGGAAADVTIPTPINVTVNNVITTKQATEATRIHTTEKATTTPNPTTGAPVTSKPSQGALSTTRGPHGGPATQQLTAKTAPPSTSPGNEKGAVVTSQPGPGSNATATPQGGLHKTGTTTVVPPVGSTTAPDQGKGTSTATASPSDNQGPNHVDPTLQVASSTPPSNQGHPQSSTSQQGGAGVNTISTNTPTLRPSVPVTTTAVPTTTTMPTTTIPPTTTVPTTTAPPKPFNEFFQKGMPEVDSILNSLCSKLLETVTYGNCSISGTKKHDGTHLFDKVIISGAVNTSVVMSHYEELVKATVKPEEVEESDSTTLIAILASCGAVALIIIVLAVYTYHHGKHYRKNQQQLTEELHTVENGYHDNPTLEVMEVQSSPLATDMAFEKCRPNGNEFNDSWIVPLDTLLKDDIPDEEDTHL